MKVFSPLTSLRLFFCFFMGWRPRDSARLYVAHMHQRSQVGRRGPLGATASMSRTVVHECSSSPSARAPSAATRASHPGSTGSTQKKKQNRRPAMRAARIGCATCDRRRRASFARSRPLRRHRSHESKRRRRSPVLTYVRAARRKVSHRARAERDRGIPALRSPSETGVKGEVWGRRTSSSDEAQLRFGNLANACCRDYPR